MKVPVVTQVAQSECGLCCSVSLLRYHGRAETVASARSDLEAGRNGLSAGHLIRFLRSRGLDARLYRARDVAALVGLKHPVVLYWEDYHFLVLESFDGVNAVVMDPSVGRRRLTRAKLISGFSNLVIQAVPGPEFQQSKGPLFEEWRSTPLFTAGARPRLALIALLSLTSYSVVLGIPLFTQWAVDRSSQFAAIDDLTLLVLGLLVAAAMYIVLQRLRIAILAALAVLLGNHLMTSAFSRLLSLPYRFFSVREPGELLFRMNTVNAVRDLLSTRVAQGILDVGTLLCITGYLVVVEWRLAILAIGLLGLNALHLTRTRGRVLDAVDAEISLLSRSQSMQLDAIVSIPTIKMGGYTSEFLAGWAKVYSDALAAMRQFMNLQQGRTLSLTAATQVFGPPLLLLIGLYLVNNGRISLGTAIAVQAVSATYFALVTAVFQAWTEFSEASRYMARISEIYTAHPESSGGSRTELPSPSISLEQVEFRYTRHEEPVLRGLSLEIPAGRTVALVGASGSGKSTLGRILCGLDKPTSGVVRFGGIDSGEYDITALRRHIGYIPQEVSLHNRTILENLAMGREISPEQVREYCSSTGVLDFVDELPMGLKTMVSEMGANFSGGQRQRLAIVRTLLQQPAILVLDEATAALDTVNEQRVSALIAESGVTRVIIAHRLATIKAADHIVVLDRGRVVEEGQHEELLENGGPYCRLYAADLAVL